MFPVQLLSEKHHCQLNVLVLERICKTRLIISMVLLLRSIFINNRRRIRTSSTKEESRSCILLIICFTIVMLQVISIP